MSTRAVRDGDHYVLSGRKAWITNAGSPGAPGVDRASAMATLFASDAATKITTDAVRLLGGSVYARDFPVERMMLDAKITRRLLEGVAAGT